MAPFELLLLSAFVAGAASVPAGKFLPSYRGAAGQWDVNAAREASSGQHWGAQNTPLLSAYQCFDGNVASHADTTKWLSFEKLWTLNEPTVLSKNRGDTYITHYIREAIMHCSAVDEIDAGLVLAIVMQESSGRVSIPCKAQANGGSHKCGLMQTTGGSSFDSAHAEASIVRMIREGVEGDGLEQALDGDARYLSDVANRLLGWDGTGPGYQLCESQQKRRASEQASQL